MHANLSFHSLQLSAYLPIFFSLSTLFLYSKLWAAYLNCTLSREFTPEKTTWIAASVFPLWKLYGSCKLLHTLENSNTPMARLCLSLCAQLRDLEAPSQGHKEPSRCFLLVLQQLLLSQGEMKQNTLSCSLSQGCWKNKASSLTRSRRTSSPDIQNKVLIFHNSLSKQISMNKGLQVL